jgi:transketolase
LTRQNVPRVHKSDTKFKIGKIQPLKPGKDALVLGTGGVLHHALEAAVELEKQGLNIEVANVSSIKPLDTDFLREALRRHKKIITVEDHYIIGGLGGAVAEFLAGEGSGKLHRIGVDDEFGQSGTPEACYEAYGLNTAHLTKKIQRFVRE